MRKGREDHERAERELLAPYAQRVGDSAGRRHPEPPHPLRTAFERDRARIVHSRAFRRLEYKTQVFLNGTGDHLRTRLTHTIEVASVSRSVARALAVSEDLAEAIALAHDLGHAPFGHAGEAALDELMRDHGGFEHNEQSRRVVEFLEIRYPHFDGLNLTEEVLEGLAKHDPQRRRRMPDGSERAAPRPALEAQIADLADEITYSSHDLDDGLDAGLITLGQLDEVTIWRECRERILRDFPGVGEPRLTAYTIRLLIDWEVADLIVESMRRLDNAGVRSADDVRARAEPLAGFSEPFRERNAQLRKFLYENLYFHPDVAEPNRRGAQMIRSVFSRYLERPEKLGKQSFARIERDGLHRVVCDYVSGMTDRYLIEEAR